MWRCFYCYCINGAEDGRCRYCGAPQKTWQPHVASGTFTWEYADDDEWDMPYFVSPYHFGAGVSTRGQTYYYGPSKGVIASESADYAMKEIETPRVYYSGVTSPVRLKEDKITIINFIRRIFRKD